MLRFRTIVPVGRVRTLDALQNNMTIRLLAGLNKAALMLQTEIQRQLSIGGGMPKGRRFTARTTRNLARLRQLERNPGMHLRVQTGNLRASWRVTPARRVGQYIEAHVFTRSVYAAIHEFGGRAGRGRSVLIPKRSYVDPALKETRDKMIIAVAQEAVGPLLR